MAFQVSVADEVAGALRVRVTETVRVIPPPVTVIVAELVPTEAEEVFTLTVKVPLLEAAGGVTVNQLALSETVQEVFAVKARD